MEIAFTEEADIRLTELELLGSEADVDAVSQTLQLLQQDPGDPRLRTKTYAGKPKRRITPCPPSSFSIVWELLDQTPPIIKVLLVADLQPR
jgi:hypothetical protein